jgi:hypothetical protein
MDKLKKALIDLEEDDAILEMIEDIKEFKQKIEQRVDDFPVPKDGKNGRDGRDGRDGLDGVDGKGTKGEKGEQGEKGDKGDKGDDGKDGKDFDKGKDLDPELKKMKTEVLTAMSYGGGGGAYRNIAVGGNPSVLSRYNDLNIKAGTNVTLSYQNNDTTKMLDLTIAATGGGAGTVRSINSISTSQTAGATAGTDYVYICSVGVNLTLPDAVGNTNLYTVKNTSTSSVLVSTTSLETIDTSPNLILATQFTSVDLISDGANWDIT